MNCKVGKMAKNLIQKSDKINSVLPILYFLFN